MSSVAQKLADLFEISWGDTKTTKAAYVDEGYPAFSAVGGDGKLDHYDHEGAGIVVSAIGAYCGKSWYVDGQWSCIKNTIYIKSKDQSNADTRFLYYAIQDDRIWPRRGGAQPFISQTDARNVALPIPDIHVQRRIASVLSAYDDLLENNRQRIQLLEQAARLLYKEWFVNLRFPGHEHVTITNAVPEGWTPATIGDIGRVVTGMTPSKKKESYYGGEIPFIKTPDMHGNTLVIKTNECLSEEGVKTQANKTLPPRSILVSCIGTVGVVSFNSSIAQTNQQINAIVPANESLRYWTLFMAKDLKPLLESIGGGVTMANVNKSKFSSIKVVIPSSLMLDQFNLFAANQIDQIEQLASMNLKLASARDLLLPRLMNGEVAV